MKPILTSWIAVFALVVFVFSIGPALAGDVPQKSKKKVTSSKSKKTTRKKDGVPWNGGKPQFPISVKTNLEPQVEADTDLDLRFEIKPEKPCSSLKTTVRGIEGVEVQGQVENEFGAASEETFTHTVLLRLRSGVAGYAVIDLRCTLEGNTYSVSKTFPFKTAGASFKKSKPKLGKSDKGEPVILLQPEMK